MMIEVDSFDVHWTREGVDIIDGPTNTHAQHTHTHTTRAHTGVYCPPPPPPFFACTYKYLLSETSNHRPCDTQTLDTRIHRQGEGCSNGWADRMVQCVAFMVMCERFNCRRWVLRCVHTIHIRLNWRELQQYLGNWYDALGPLLDSIRPCVQLLCALCWDVHWSMRTSERFALRGSTHRYEHSHN